MISNIIENTVFWINTLTVNSGMFCTISTRTLMTGITMDFNKHYKIEFGAYTKATKKTFPQKSTQSPTEPAIYLRPTGNLQCYYWFLNLHTWRRIKHNNFTPLPFLTRVIDHVHALADTNKEKPALDFFELLGNTIPYGDTPDDKNEDYAKDLAGVEECENQPKMPGVKTIYHQEETPGVTTPEEEEEIMEI